MSGNDQLTPAQLREVKKILNDLVKEQLIDDNKFQVSEIHKLLTTFNLNELEKELARSTKQTFLNVAALLERTTLSEDATVVGDVQAANNKLRNDEHKETTEVFLGLMDDDRWDSPNDGGSSSNTSYGKATRNHGKLNAVEALLCMCFGGVNERAPNATINAGDERNTTVTAAADGSNYGSPTGLTLTAKDTQGANGLFIDSHEARATYLMALWAKHASGSDSAIKLFGNGAMKIKVTHAISTGACDITGCATQVWCCSTTVNQTYETREYFLWDQTANGTNTSLGKGKNHFVNILGALVEHKPAESRGIGQSHLLGGEDGLSIDNLQQLCSNDGGFSTAQLKRVFKLASEIGASSTVSQINNVRELGFTDMENHLGIVIDTSKSDSVFTDFATAFGAGKRLQVNQRGVTTPALKNVLESKFGNELLEKLAVYSETGGSLVDLRAIETLVSLKMLTSNNNEITESSSTGTETGTKKWQALQGALTLINRVEGLIGAELSESWLDVLAKHNNETDAKAYQSISTTFMDRLITDKTYTGLAADSSYYTRNDETVFNYLTYNTKVNDYGLDEAMMVKKTIVELYPNEYYKEQQSNSIRTSAQKIIYNNFKSSPANFLDNLEPQVSMYNAPVSGQGANAQLQANLDVAFGPGSWSTTNPGSIFGQECQGLGSNKSDFAQEKARIFVFLFSMLDSESVKELLEDEVVYNQCAQQAVSLLKVTQKTSTTNTLLSFKDSSVIRVSLATNVANKTPYLIGSVTPASWINLSGKFIDKEHFGNGHDNDETIRDYTINVLAYQLFNGNANETCKLQLVNNVQLSADKIQELAKVFDLDSNIADFQNAQILSITSYTEMNTAMSSGGSQEGKICNIAFVNAAFSAIAKATNRPTNGNGTYYNPNNAVEAADEIKTRNLTLIENVRGALKGANDEGVFEFFWMMQAMANDDTDNVDRSLAKSIMNQLALQLSESSKDSTHHLPSGWASYEHPKITDGDERRAVLTEAIKRYFVVSGVVSSGAQLTVGSGAPGATSYGTDNNNIEQADINNIDAYNGSSKSKINKVDMYVQKLARIIAHKYTLMQLITELDLENASGRLGDFGKLLVMYVCAYKNEKQAEAYKLYDVPSVSCAGLSQYSITRLIETGYITVNDLEEGVLHSVRVIESVDNSYTNASSDVEAHRFVAVDPSTHDIVECTGFDPSGEPEYSAALEVTAATIKYNKNAAPTSDEQQE